MFPFNPRALSLLILSISALWTNRRGAPWLPTPMAKVHQMLQMAEVGPGDLVYDLGCGDGRVIVTAARDYGARAVGIELDPLRWAWCQVLITVMGLRGQVRVVYGDFFSKDLSGADVVTCYLLQRTNEELQGKFLRQLMPGARVVSHAFTFPGLRLRRWDGEADLHLYTMG